MLAKKQTQEQIEKITVDEYLEGERVSEIKHEFIEGQVYAMAGANENHDYISGNIYRKFGNHLENSSCRPFTSDMKVKTAKGNFRYPDCMVVCADDNEDPYYKTQPTILVEVLSQSTQKIDRKDKLLEYINITSLQEYIIIEQDYVNIEVFRRDDNWYSKHYFLGDQITLKSIDLTLTVEEIYHRVNNEDMVEFLAKKQDSDGVSP